MFLAKADKTGMLFFPTAFLTYLQDLFSLWRAKHSDGLDFLFFLVFIFVCGSNFNLAKAKTLNPLRYFFVVEEFLVELK